ncbi:MAG: chemotaxis protein CheB, partial [Gammaproteobacteria bacterium]|nr:chemotaxis protein CheB [Gammaproteobacteria bacterium]
MNNLNIDVVILDIDEDTQDCDVFEQLLDETRVPIIFNDVSALTLNKPVALEQWYGKLLQKIAELTGKAEWESLDVNKAFSVMSHELSGRQVKNFYRNKVIPANTELAKNVWVLGSSLGGPEMLKQFLSALTDELPVAFVIAQHMGANFTTLLAEQL